MSSCVVIYKMHVCISPRTVHNVRTTFEGSRPYYVACTLRVRGAVCTSVYMYVSLFVNTVYRACSSPYLARVLLY